MKPLRAKVLAVAAGVAMVAAACGGAAETPTESAAESATTTSDAGSESTTAQTTPPVQPTGLVGEFSTIGGATFDLGDLEGEDVVLWFWAPW